MKKNYYYTDRSQTPLTWHNWFIFTLGIGSVISLGSLFTSFLNFNYLSEIIDSSELIVTLEVITGFECICNIVWAILCIITAIGLSKFKTSGWICLIAAFITRPVLNLVIGCMWMSFDLSLGIASLISAFVIALSDIPIYIYYNKRKPLFFPEMINNIADEQKVKYLEMTHKDPEQLYKSENLNKTIPLSDDE